PVGFYTKGVTGDFRSHMHYMGYGTPLQSYEEIFSYWHEKQPAPFVFTETSLWSFLYGFLWQVHDNSVAEFNIRGAPTVFAEHAARYFGNWAYDAETPETIEKTKVDLGATGDDSNFTRLTVLAVKNCLRSWRTYGVSYQFMAMTTPTHLPHIQELSRIDSAFAEFNSPFLAYIAGPANNFVAKDHAFFAGETIEKQVIFINANFHDIQVDAEWSLIESETGKKHQTWRKNFSIPAGEQTAHAFEFAAPVTDKRADFTIELAVRHNAGNINDVFEIEIFPRLPKPERQLGKRVILMDENFGTRAVLQKAGVEFETFEKALLKELPDDNDVLVIGRKSFPSDTNLVAEIFQRVSEGMNVLCFEQVVSNVFGLKCDDPNLRHVFVSAQDHPIVEGLRDREMRNWRGSSEILDPYPDYREDFEYGLVDGSNAKDFFGHNDFAHWSLKGTVAAFHFHKPQTGNFRILASSGFDLLYSPLMELIPGKGRIIVCSLNVTERYGLDPIATLLINRMLDYILESKPMTNKRFALWRNVYSGGWTNILFKELGLKYGAIESPEELRNVDTVWLGAGEMKILPEDANDEAAPNEPLLIKKEITTDANDVLMNELDDLLAEREKDNGTHPAVVSKSSGQALISFVESGGTLIIAAAGNSKSLEWLPLKIGLKKKQTFLGKTAGMSELSGLTDSDFFYRKVMEIPVITELPANGRIQEGGLFAVLPYSKGKFIFLQVYPEMFSENWQRTKILRVINVLLGNMGVRPDRSGEAVARSWYAAEALNFDPDQHRCW
ncbi:MAG: hypothetical protein JXN60_00910, partial [Lentisphaerae bacterium]|nr:hypothetical protein [Lentisphaerota bacterium]